jgi:lipopolysaccharide export system permease protein
MLSKIDKYIIKKFLGTFFLALTLIISIAIIFDLSEKMDDFLDKGAPLSAIVFDYYINFIPYFANLFSPLFVFIAVIFFTSRMAAKSEFIAMFSSGLSFRRLLVPYLFSAIIITSFSFVLSNYIIPDANKTRIAFQNMYIRSSSSSALYGEYNIHRQIEPGVYFFVESYNKNRDIGLKVSLEKFNGMQLVSKLNADMMLWDSVTNRWIMQNYVIRNFDGDRERIISGNRLDTAFRLKPDDFARRTNIVEAMNRKELDEYIDEQRLMGTSDVINSEIEKYMRISAPFATFILTLIGVSLSIRKVRGGIGLNIGIGLLLSFSYILFIRFSTVFALSGMFSAELSVWIPNIIFLIIASLIYYIFPK